MNHRKKSLLIVGVATLLLATGLTNSDDEKAVKKFGLPGVVQINDTLYYDEAEIANIDWREYCYWTAKVFGINSDEFKNALPDTSVWGEADTSLFYFNEHYFRHPTYNLYPVVGVNQKQAEAFCKWRSDRVFERLLIDLKKIEERRNQTDNNFFTIEKYLNDTYQGTLKGKKIRFFPEYRLPTLSERKIFMAYSDSLDKAQYAKCKNKSCKECSVLGADIQSRDKNSVQNKYNDIVAQVQSSCAYKRNGALHHLRGNVSEWSSEDGIAFGGGWNDLKQRIIETDTFHTNSANAYTGLRCVCNWREWEK